MSKIARLLMPGGRLARHQTLLFHRVLPQLDPMSPSEVDQTWFDGLLAELNRHFEIIPLGDAVELAAQKALPAASLSITFDDGYADNFLHALPVLEKHRAHATFFIATGYLDGGRMWNDTLIETCRTLPSGEHQLPPPWNEKVQINGHQDRLQLARRLIGFCKYLPAAERQVHVDTLAALATKPLPDDLMLNTDQLRQLGASHFAELGAHTHSHPILANCDQQQARVEIQQSIDRLEQLTGQRPRLFAYPNGKLGQDFALAQTGLVEQCGLRAAVSTDWGVLNAKTDLSMIPRFTPWRRSYGRFAIDLLRARYGWY